MEFLKTLCTVSALISLALLFLPEASGIKRASYTAFALLLLLFLIPKDGSFRIADLITFESKEEAPESDAYEETVQGAIVNGIKADIASRYSLDTADVAVSTDLTLNEEGLTGSYLSLTLCGKGFFADVTSLLHYLESAYAVDCEVHFVGA